MGLFGSEPRLLADGAIYAEARSNLVIVSPYIAPTDDFVRQLESAAIDRKVEVKLVFRRDKFSEYRNADWLRRLGEAGVLLRMIDRLHSKIYRSENAAIVTSMNFVSGSGENSFEAGIFFENDHKLMRQLESYLDSLERHFEAVRMVEGARRQRDPSSRSIKAATSARVHRQGHCLRCGDSIPLDVSRPYCIEDFEKWARYENEDYEDKYCHACGKTCSATMRKPLCRDCYSLLS
ncbi:phospholipase D family protein [Stigmatella hybrida]|uniref:phospholipase D family protein n=1 Tax=Stigmatella hybrida TaxID=394097 RepID=UPI001CDB3CC4|nr:phospholipase D family protein [Stigmatella hybrida]